MPTVFASDTKKAVHEDATTKVRLELVKHKGRQFAAPCFQIRQKRRPMFLYRSIKQSRFGTMARVHACTDGRVGMTACCWLRGKHQQKFSATRQYLLLAKRSIRHSKSARDAVDLLGGTRPDRPRMYLAADTHWTGDGARFAAGLLAARVREMLGPSPLQPKHSYRRETVTVPRRPDIPRMSRLRGEATAFPISWRFVCPRQ